MIRRTATQKKPFFDDEGNGEQEGQEENPSGYKMAMGAPAITIGSDSNTRYTSNAAPSMSTAIINQS